MQILRYAYLLDRGVHLIISRDRVPRVERSHAIGEPNLQQPGTICGASPGNARVHVAEQSNRDAVGGADTNTGIICTTQISRTYEPL